MKPYKQDLKYIDRIIRRFMRVWNAVYHPNKQYEKYDDKLRKQH